MWTRALNLLKAAVDGELVPQILLGGAHLVRVRGGVRGRGRVRAWGWGEG